MEPPKKVPSPPDFETLVNTYYQPLFRFAYSLAKNQTDACDLTQETFHIWAKKGASLRDPSKAKSWLFTTLYREFLRLKRFSQREPTHEEQSLEIAMPLEPKVLESLDAHEAVALLDKMDTIYRVPLTLFYLKDLSYKEIAKILNIPLGTVMSRLSRGKAQLKQHLTENLPSKA